MKKIFGIIAAIVMGVTVLGSPVLIGEPVNAATCYCKNGNKGVQTNFLGEDGYEDEKGSKPLGDGIKCSCDDGKGSQVTDILIFVIQVLSVCIGILGVLGIAITGFQYLTAGGNEEKTRKAKKRLLDIVIGLVAYVLMYAFLMWLLPTFDDNTVESQSRETTSIDTFVS